MFDVLSWLSSDTGLIFAQISNTNIVSEWEMINVDISTIDNYNTEQSRGAWCGWKYEQ